MKKKITAIIAIAACAALLLSACGSGQVQQTTAAAGEDPTPVAKETTTAEEIATTTEETTDAAEETIAEEKSPDELLAGGWTINDTIVSPVMTTEAQNAFEAAMNGYVGMNLEPAALLATQVVAGTNYLILCKGEAVVQNPVPGWYLVTVYEDLEGNAAFTAVEDLDLSAYLQ